MPRKRLFLWGGGVALAAVVVLGLIFGRSGSDTDAYAWDTVTRGDIRETLSASGEIQARTKVNIGTMVGGEIKAIHVVDGQDVKAGELLVTIDPERLRQELARSEAALEAARKDLSRAEATLRSEQEAFRRMEALHGQGLISHEEFRRARLSQDTARLAFQSGEANVLQVRATVATQRDYLSKTTLRAPMAGRVTGLKAEKGETAIAGMTNLPGAVLMVISDMNEIVAEVRLNEAEVVRCRPGQSAQVSVESLPGRTFRGQVVEVATASEKVGQDANLYRVKVALDMKTQDIALLRVGMSARAVILASESKGALRIPLQAVLEREGSLEEAQKKGLLAPESRSVVFTVEGSRAKEIPVKVGIANTQFYELLEGASEGTRVLTGPVRKLKELKDRASVTLKARSDAELDRQARRKSAKP